MQDSQESQESRQGANRRQRLLLLALAFAAGLFLGWMVIGWWLWPVQWTNTDPWHLRQKHQKTYISLVAENFWWTKDIHQAREALAGWDDEAVAELLATMQREASSPEARQQLAALAEALKISTPEESLWASLFSQKIIFLSSILSALPLTAAIVLAVSSFVQNRTQRAAGLLAEEEQLEEALEEMLAGEESALGGGQDQAQKEQQAEGEGEEEEYYGDEEEEEEEPWVQDLVSVLFDEDDTEFSQLEALCEKLPDIDVSDLSEHSRQVADQLRRGNLLRYGSEKSV